MSARGSRGCVATTIHPTLRGRPLTANSSRTERAYIPAAGHDWLLVFYDPIAKLLGTESAHRALIDQARLGPGQRVLEIGCGTGNLMMLVKSLHPAVDLVGLDPDPKALDRARRKADRRRVAVTLDRGYADELPYPDGSFDRVLSALMLHHLQRDEKSRALHQVRRVLRPGGSLHVLDFGGAGDRSDGFLARLLHRSEHFRDNSPATILALMRDAGFVDPSEVGQRGSVFGRMSYYHASR
jgi:cyclopropane fatty-acyl-phospholipid synthase-like methyltransferase